MMKIGIIGVGGLACLFGSFLSPLADVVLLGGWQEQIRTLQTQGLKLIGADGRSQHHVLQATGNVDDMGQVDVALVLVKSGQTAQAVEVAERILAPHGLAITLQNGLGNWEKLTAVLGRDRAALGSTSQGATVLGPGVVRHAGHGPTYLARSATTAVRLEAVAQCFQQAGLETHLVDEVAGLVWGKLAVNTGINPLTALLGVPNGFLAQDAQARWVMMQTAEETAVVAQAQGIQLPYPSAGQRALAVAQATASNTSSMLQDVLRGVPTEIEAICGAVVATGRQRQMATPLNGALLTAVHALEKGQNQFSLPQFIQQMKK